MLETAYAVLGHVKGDKYSRIYSNLTDFQEVTIPWRSFDPPDPSRSKAVNSRIWAFHGAMGTTCDGSTSIDTDDLNNVLEHPTGLINGQWNLDFWFRGFPGWGFTPLNRVVSHYGRPVLLCGTGFPEGIGAVRPNLAEAGHAVVTFGGNSQNGTLYICMGWGELFPNKWIVPESIGNRFIILNFTPHD
jgi:hypothetical protein